MKKAINAFEQEFTRPDYDHITGYDT